jgi:pimeloyl-ACP methyl ester carboxylesterase
MFTFNGLFNFIDNGFKFLPLGNRIEINAYSDENYILEQNQKYLLQDIKWNIHSYCIGNSTNLPTVILVSGEGSGLISMIGIQENLKNFTKVCSIDLSGYGFSDSGILPRTIAQHTAEIKQVLEKNEINENILFVGSQIGTLIGQFFIYKYSNITKGFLSLGSEHEFSEYYDIKENKPELNDDEIFNEILSSSNYVNFRRYLSPLGFDRFFIKQYDFYPQIYKNYHTSLFNSKYWNSKYFDEINKIENAKILNNSRWKFSNGLILKDINSIFVVPNKTFNLFKINDMLSRSTNSKLILCQSCNENNFIFENPDYCSNIILEQLKEL